MRASRLHRTPHRRRDAGALQKRPQGGDFVAVASGKPQILLVRSPVNSQGPQMFDPQLGGGVGVGQRHELSRNEAVVAGGVQDIQNRHEIQVPGARIPAIGVRHVKVKNAVADGPDAVLDFHLLDVHVKSIEQEPEVVRAHPLDEIQPLGRGVDEIGLVSVHGLEGESHSGARGRSRARLDRLDQIIHGPLVGLSFGSDPTDETEDDDGVEVSGQRHVTRDPLDGRSANLLVVAGE